MRNFLWPYLGHVKFCKTYRDVNRIITHTISMMLILKVISKLCSAENNTYQSEEASELGHIGLLYCLLCQIKIH